jgi:hypothetical protein
MRAVVDLRVKYASMHYGDRLLQRGTIYGAHRMSGGTIYDNIHVGGPGGGGRPLV